MTPGGEYNWNPATGKPVQSIDVAASALAAAVYWVAVIVGHLV
jgi:hypothetical protein